MNSRQSTYFSTYSRQGTYGNYADDEPQSPDTSYNFPTAPFIAEPEMFDFPRPGLAQEQPYSQEQPSYQEQPYSQQPSYSQTPSPSFTSTTFTTTGPETPSPDQSFYGTLQDRKGDDGSFMSSSSGGFGFDEMGDRVKGFGEDLHKDWDKFKGWFGKKVGRQSPQSSHSRSQSESHKRDASQRMGRAYQMPKSREATPTAPPPPPPPYSIAHAVTRPANLAVPVPVPSRPYYTGYYDSNQQW